MKPQSRAVLALLRERPSGVSQRTAITVLGCYRLAARVADLRAEGYTVTSEMVAVDSSRFAVYRLVEAPEKISAFG